MGLHTKRGLEKCGIIMQMNIFVTRGQPFLSSLIGDDM